MTLKDFELTEDNHFVAMEYYALILNRTYLVLMTNDYLIGLLGNGIVSVESSTGLYAKKITKSLAINGDLNNPHCYLKETYIRKIENVNLLDGSILTENKSNFIIKRNEIKKAWYDPRKKWGMGYYPHDGKVYIETIVRKKREFIILGNQSGRRIADNIIMAK